MKDYTALALLKRIPASTEDGDEKEYNHVEADNILCRFLDELGYSAIVIEYKKIDKWYA